MRAETSKLNRALISQIVFFLARCLPVWSLPLKFLDLYILLVTAVGVRPLPPLEFLAPIVRSVKLILPWNLKDEIKVGQFSGSVSETSCYHHGENSLNGAIVGMAQNHVGSNNINLLEPKGQFGTRLQGGSDSASERYIYTNLNPLTREIFQAKDDVVLNYLDDDDPMLQEILFKSLQKK